MYDIKPLEEEWEQYRKNKRRPYVVIGLALFLMSAGTGTWYYMKKKGYLALDRNITKKVKPNTMNFVENKALTRLEVRQVVQVEPEMLSNEIVENLPLSEEKKVHKKPRVKMNIVTTEIPMIKKHVKIEEKPHERVHLTIKETSGSRAFKEVAQRFKETQDPDDSLFLAKAYYNRKQYSKAAYWAFQTNNINSGIEESVLIFVKAKVKLGHKNEAIRILSKYIKQTDSKEAKILLKEINKGKI